MIGKSSLGLFSNLKDARSRAVETRVEGSSLCRFFLIYLHKINTVGDIQLRVMLK